MKQLLSACAVAAAMFVASAGAQDTTIKSKTKIDADDAKIMTMTGCLQAGPSADVFLLSNATVVSGGEMESKSRTTIDVDDDETEVKTTSETEIERDDDDDDKAVGTAGRATAYELTPGSGVNLAPHVGHRVEISALALEPKDGDDDAEVDIETETKVQVDDAPDSKVKSKTEAELPRGTKARLAAVAVKHIAASCTP